MRVNTTSFEYYANNGIQSIAWMVDGCYISMWLMCSAPEGIRVPAAVTRDDYDSAVWLKNWCFV